MTEQWRKRARTESGILPSHWIRWLLAEHQIQPSIPTVPGQIQPASLDLRLGGEAVRVRASFLPNTTTSIAERLDDLGLHRIDIREGAVLETGCVYVVPLLEQLALAPEISAIANPKSSTGRLDVFTRVIADGVTSFDQIPAGYSGRLYAEICPQTFPIVVRQGSRLSQIRFRIGQAGDADAETRELHRQQRLVSSDEADVDHGIALSVDLEGSALAGSGSGSRSEKLVGYRAKRHTGIVDVDRPGACALDDYWEAITLRDTSRLILDPDQFYILASKEAVHVPPTHAAEMVPFNPLVGEFRVHYAGFFDPGFGHDASGGTGSRAVLEVRSHKVPFILEDSQIVGRLIYERMVEVPDQLYGRDIGSHYQAQGLKLSKHFK